MNGWAEVGSSHHTNLLGDLASRRPVIQGSNFKHHLSQPESGGLTLLLKIGLVELLLVLGMTSLHLYSCGTGWDRPTPLKLWFYE